MANLGPSPYLELSFEEDGDGGMIAPTANELASLLAAPGTADLVIISHGWRNSPAEARTLYKKLWANTVTTLQKAGSRPERFAVAGIFWPATALCEDIDSATLSPVASGGIASSRASTNPPDLDDERFETMLTSFTKVAGSRASVVVDAARTAVKSNATEVDALKLVRALMRATGADVAAPDAELEKDRHPVAAASVSAPKAMRLLADLKEPPVLTLSMGAGLPLGLGNTTSRVTGLFDGPRAAAARLINYLTFYKMKSRAGIVGGLLADEVLAKINPPGRIRLHLVGHSFGARLVTAATNNMPAFDKLELTSLTLLQGAFSHNGLSVPAGGAFQKVVGKPKGPISITHTHNDKACTIAYALASRLARNSTSAVGDANDEFGAMGANGPQKLAPGTVSAVDNATFEPARGKVTSYLADTYISAHSDVTNVACGRLLAATIAA